MSASPSPAVTILDADPRDFAIEVRRDGDAHRVTLRLDGAHPVDAAVRVTVELARADDPWWLIPGLFYGENRPAANDRLYPRFEAGARTSAQHAAFVSDEWHFRSDRAATPVVLAWPAPGMPGRGLSADPVTELGLTGLGFALRGSIAELSATFPAREFPVTYYGDGTPRPAEVQRHRFEPGDEVEVVVRVHELAADRHDYARVLRDLHAASAPRAPLRPWMGVAAAAGLSAEGLLRWHYDPEPGVLLETVGFDREVSGRDGESVDRQAMHVGWVSGIPWAYAMLRHAERTADLDARAERALEPAASALRDAALSVIDFCTAELAPSGTLWGVWYRGRGWTQSWTTRERGLHSRTLGEATHFLVRALKLTEREQWRHAVRSNLDVVVARQRADGNLGSIHHAETGEVLSWDGSAGLAWVGALVEAADDDDRYLDAAERAGRYYARFVHDEYLHGAPEDVDLAVTSEDGYVAVMAYMALHRATGDPEWLELARRAADFALTFRYTYDVDFARGTLLGIFDFGTRGADQASASNQHLHAYGLICTRELLELADATGDDHYRERALETLACFRQFVARFDGDFNAYRGMVTERYYQTECFQPKGMLLTLSHAWSAGVLLLGCEDALAVDAG
ncbi:glycoside hydrolase family 127 protein [Microbacterium sp. QXD-8]|uniref:Glycoside hydrolase family 127 protein n=1 Tax=Microbacterium psychrotolerans TaxID=3068321 RepID=A0ABU0YVQ1_9MICO|nr:beta-L-arabinofuranosidase domain-containing protein [Microbacterium sp. QXD-8]MDQ7876409.1 glycoside hydrolase family 127 protein [Microbacterium sp. QXD-8]